MNESISNSEETSASRKSSAEISKSEELPKNLCQFNLFQNQLPNKNFVLKSSYFKDFPSNESNSSKESILMKKEEFSKQNPVLSYFLEKTEENDYLKNDFQIESKEVNYQGLIEYLRTQKGCRIYQNRILKSPSYGNNILYKKLIPYMVEIINSRYGNHLYRVFIDVLYKQNLIHFINFISENFLKIAYNSRGKKVIQKLIQKISFDNKLGIMIYQTLKQKTEGNVLKMSIDENAAGIVIHFLTLLQSPWNDFIFEEIYNSFLSISNSKFGCCVIQKSLIHGNEAQRKNITNLILKNTFNLISHQYGNYVYQCLIKNCDDLIIIKIFCMISCKFFKLCQNKYSSNVIENFFEIVNKELFHEMVKYILQFESGIVDLICNEFGNCIIQKILTSMTDQNLTNKFIKIVFDNVNRINQNEYGVIFLSKFTERYSLTI